jgi:chromosomal replication initiation ATPase DnaA
MDLMEAIGVQLLNRGIVYPLRKPKRFVFRNRPDKARQLLAAIVKEWRITKAEILGAGRTQHLAHARMAFAHLALTRIGMTRSAIARYLEKDHTTVCRMTLVFSDHYAKHVDLRHKFNRVSARWN